MRTFAFRFAAAGTAAVFLSLLLHAQTTLPAPSQPTTRSVGPYDTSAWIGTNYTPAYCSNQVQLWHDFRPEVIDKELAAAVRHLGINTLRVYLHNMVYEAEKDKFLQRIEQFLAICDKHGIRPGFTFFDDCWNHAGVTLEPQPPIPGRHNGRWAALQDAQRKDACLPMFKAYVQDVVSAHKADKRVLWWEAYNEPNLKDAFTARIRHLAYQWAKEAGATQPVIACWDDNPDTDIVNAHGYGDDFREGGAWDRQADLNPRKGTVFTEAGARWYAGKGASNGSPIEVIRWLSRRRAQGRSTPGVYLCWELMVGNSNCRWYWGTSDGAGEPPIPWCGLMMPDCTPVSYAESEAVRSYITGKKQAMLFEDFESAPPPADPPDWKRFAASGRPGSGYLSLEGQTKLVAGQADWTDYLLEATVMLKGEGGNAGLVFRVNEPGPKADQMSGYYAGLDLKTLYLGKMRNNWQPLASVDLAKLQPKVQPNAWNLLRVAVRGDRIRVWLNPLHDDARPRIDFRDQDHPVLQGAVGVRTHGVTAAFDDLVVLPIEALEN